MYHTPFSVLLGYDMPTGKGIYTLPASNEAPSGWGEPRWDTSKTPWEQIKPGTIGGPLERVLLRRTKGVYKASASKWFQKGGNIAWYGEYLVPAKPTKGRWCLSYAGPKLKYFREPEFTYGSTSDHNEIYINGYYATVAPGPVLGACLRTIDWYDPITMKTAPERFLVAVVYKDGVESFYQKRFKSVIGTLYLSDEVREKQMKMYDAAEEPYGWMPMGIVSPSPSSYPPETPWFFNRSGTAAACMRRRNPTFNNGNEDVTENSFDRYKAIVGDSTISFSNNGNLAPMAYREQYTKLYPAVYVSTDREGYTHEWQEDHMKVSITLTGAHYVMCDYVGDDLYYGKVKYTVNRLQEQYYTKGLDLDGYTNAGGSNISNNRYAKYYGPYWFDGVRYGYYDPDYIPTPGDHNATVWINIDEDVILYYGKEGNDETDYVFLHYYRSGTSDEWAGNPRQTNNPYLYFLQFATRFLRGFMDIRKMAFFAYDWDRYSLVKTGVTYDKTVNHSDTLYTEANTSGDKKRTVKKSSQVSIDMGWDRTTMETWPQTFAITLDRTTYDGSWPSDNANGEIQVPGSRTFYDGDGSGDLKADWPTLNLLLYDEKNKCKGNGVLDEFDAVAYSLEVPDVEKQGEYVVLSDVVGYGDPASMIGYGTKFYPLGVC